MGRVSSRTYRFKKMALDFVKSLLGKRVKIDLNDGRWLIGNFYCTDKDLNLCISNCEEYVKEGQEPRQIGIAMVTKKTLSKIYLLKGEEEQQTASENTDNTEQELTTLK